MTAKDHGKRYRCIFRFKDAAPEIITITFDSTKHKTPQGQAWTLATAMFGDAVVSVTVMPGQRDELAEIQAIISDNAARARLSRHPELEDVFDKLSDAFCCVAVDGPRVTVTDPETLFNRLREILEPLCDLTDALVSEA